MARERCPKARRSSGANQRALRSSAGVFLAALIACPPTDAVLVPHVLGVALLGKRMMIARRGFTLAAAAGLLAWSLEAAAQAPDRAALLATLMKLEVESWQFLKDKNVEGAKDYLADDATLIFGDGTRYSKADYLKVMPDFRLDSVTIEPNAEIRIWSADVATLLYRVTYASALKDAKAVTMKAWASSTYVRRGGKWLSVLYQETPLP